jgi:hypothetical protein
VRPLGYIYTGVVKRPGWLKATQVDDIYSLSGCISAPFADYIKYWKHNGFWLFDSPAAIERLAISNSISLEGLQLFYYEAHEEQYDDKRQVWEPYAPEDHRSGMFSPVLQRVCRGNQDQPPLPFRDVRGGRACGRERPLPQLRTWTISGHRCFYGPGMKFLLLDGLVHKA